MSEGDLEQNRTTPWVITVLTLHFPTEICGLLFHSLLVLFNLGHLHLHPTGHIMPIILYVNNEISIVVSLSITI